MIVKRSGGYHVVSESGKNLGGPYKSRRAARKRLRQVEYFKHKGKSASLSTWVDEFGIALATEVLRGGKGDDRPDSDFDPKELARGILTELEHTDDFETAKEIAKDHLTEDKDYYKKLTRAGLSVNEVMHECLMECGGDVEAGLAAAEYIINDYVPAGSVDTFLAHDIHNRQAQGILNRSMKAAKGLSRTAKRELATVLEKQGSDLGNALLNFVDRYRLQLAKVLTATQLAALLEGAQEVANKLPARDVPVEGLPIVEQERIANLASSPPSPPFTVPAPTSDDPSGIHFPTIDEAVKNLAERKVLTRPEYDDLEAAARAKAFTVANVQAEETLTKIRDSLAENVNRGTDYEVWKKQILQDVDQGTFMSDAHQETVFRTNVQTAFSDGQMAVLSHPLVRSGFPYSAYDAIHDDRVRENHLALEKLGIQETNVYRNDDPVFQTFRPPWDYNDRCGWTPLTVRQAAEKGIAEAQEWLRTGVEPADKAFVAMPDFRPPDGFQRSVAGAPLSIQLSLQPMAVFSTDESGHEHGAAGSGHGGQFTSQGGSDRANPSKPPSKQGISNAGTAIARKVGKALSAGIQKAAVAIDKELEGGSATVIEGMKQRSPAMIVQGIARAITSSYSYVHQEVWENAAADLNFGGAHMVGKLASKAAAKVHSLLFKGIAKGLQKMGVRLAIDADLCAAFSMEGVLFDGNAVDEIILSIAAEETQKALESIYSEVGVTRAVPDVKAIRNGLVKNLSVS